MRRPESKEELEQLVAAISHKERKKIEPYMANQQVCTLAIQMIRGRGLTTLPRTKSTNETGAVEYLTEEEQRMIKQKLWPKVKIIHGTREGSGLLNGNTVRRKGEIICNYGGRVLSKKEGDALAKKGGDAANYLLYVKQGGADYYIENSDNKDEIGRYINHSHYHPNCKPIVKRWPGGEPEVVFLAIREIGAHHQIVFDYGADYKWAKLTNCVSNCVHCAMGHKKKGSYYNFLTSPPPVRPFMGLRRSIRTKALLNKK